MEVSAIAINSTSGSVFVAGEFQFLGNGACVSKLAQWSPTGVAPVINNSLTPSNWIAFGNGIIDTYPLGISVRSGKFCLFVCLFVFLKNRKLIFFPLF